MFKKILLKLKSINEYNKNIADKCVMINLKRIYFTSLIIALLHLLHIIQVLNTDVNNLWKHIIVWANAIMLIIVSASFFVIHLIKKKPNPGRMAYGVQYLIVVSTMVFGLIITLADQMLTNDISSYVFVCLIIGTVLLIRPLYSLIIYLLSYTVFYFIVAFGSLSSEMILTSQMNGLSVTVVALLISVIMWRYNYINIIQKQHIQNQQEQLEKANAELEIMAYSDPLTGLPNRRHFDEIVKKEIMLMKRKGHSSSLIMIDIDFFKDINDSYGHPGGDDLLVQISNLISHNIRKYDEICRLGGEEFIILLPQTSLDQAKSAAEKLRKHIETTRFYLEDKEIRITASFGVTMLSSDNETTLMKNYANADHALYLAKEDGRNCVKTHIISDQDKKYFQLSFCYKNNEF